MTLINSGTINANAGTLNLNAAKTTNKGTLEATGSGTLAINATVSNSGTIVAGSANSFVDIAGVVSGGAVEVRNGIVDVLSGGTANIVFVTNDSGGLAIADSSGQTSAFTGTVSGFGGATHTNHNQYIDLTSVSSAGAITISYTSASGNKSGTLDVLSASTLVAAINLIGAYSAGNFHVSAGQGGTVEITDPSAVPQGGSVQSANLALFGSYIAGSFITAAGAAGSSTSPTSDSQPPLLTHPHV
jgi:hypothetical protein